MTPMIDVVFLLLIFFLWTSSFQAIETLLPSQLTIGGAAGPRVELQQEDFERIVVRIASRDGAAQWQINQQPVASLVELRQRLAQLASIKADLPVVVDPLAEVPFGDVIDVYDVALGVGLSNIQFATRAELLGSSSGLRPPATPRATPAGDKDE
jgi:biopolymer transport protein ExbD